MIILNYYIKKTINLNLAKMRRFVFAKNKGLLVFLTQKTNRSTESTEDLVDLF